MAQFWTDVFELINVRLQLSFPVSPELALLGIQGDAQRPHCTKLLHKYYVSGMHPQSPLVALWESSINAVLPMYKLTYINRNCPKKYDRIWQPWTAQ